MKSNKSSLQLTMTNNARCQGMRASYGRSVAIATLAGALTLFHGETGSAAPSNVQSSTRNKESSYAIAERGSDHRVWQSITASTNSAGNVTFHTNSFVEMATGMHRLKDGEWTEADPGISINADGSVALATNTQHQVGFAADLRVAGAIDLVTPRGDHLKSTVVGLVFDDPSTGKQSSIADLQNSIGQVLPSQNQVIYTNALTDAESSFYADVLYTHRRNRFEQDIVLRQQPPSPAQFGMNPATTRLQVWTEFFESPEPNVTTQERKAEGQENRQHVLEDEKLNFGSMEMGLGNAFPLVGANNTAEAAVNGTILVPVAKHWVHKQGRTFLIEEVPFDAIIPQLNALPPSIPNDNATAPGTAGSQAFFPPVPKKSQQDKMQLRPMRLAKVDVHEHPGFVLDYNLVNASKTNFTFQSDTTYYLSGECDFYGTTSLEGGAVIKCQTDGEVAVIMNGEVNCLTAPYHPAIFTCTNDNSVGVALSPTHNPQVSISTFVGVQQGGSLRNVRFSYAWNALSASGTNVQIYDCQFINCNHPISVNTGTTNLGLHNVLISMDDSINNSTNFCSCPAGAITPYSTSIKIYGEHVTADLGSQNLLTYFTFLSDPSHTSVNFTNSILIARSLKANYFGTLENWITVGTNATYYSTNKPGTLFQTVGAGKYYLADDTLRDIGSSNISPALILDLQQKTTYPPTVFANQSITGDWVLPPQVERDGEITPDLGYHYDPIDFAMGATFGTNATITIQPGTVVAGFDTNSSGYSLAIGPGSQLLSQGTPDYHSWFVNYNMVQEMATNDWATPLHGLIVPNWMSNGPASLVSCRFTDFSVPANDTAHLYAFAGNTAPIVFQDCQFHGGSITSTNATINLTNCLLERVASKLWSYDTNTPVVRNNLFWNGTNDIQFPGKTNAVIQDNLYDQTGINDHGSSSYVGGYNGFVSNYNRLTLTSAHDVILPVSPSYQSWVLGNYYLPTNSALLNVGHTNANLVGLYHYTMLTNQVKETTNIVSIGYHYVALNTSGTPDDTDGDGVPDYLEDTNGNGLFDAGDLNSWLTYNSPNGLSLPNGLEIFTPLR